MTNQNNAPLDFDPTADYAAEVKAEQGGDALLGDGGDAAPAVDPSQFESGVLKQVAAANEATVQTPEVEDEIAQITAELKGETRVLDEPEKTPLAAKVIAGVTVAGAAAAAISEVAKEVLGANEVAPEAQEAMDYLKKKGFYKEQFAALNPGEVPSEKFVGLMVGSLLGDPLTRGEEGLDKARALTENLPYDHGYLKDSVSSKILESFTVTDRAIKMLEIAGVNPSELHDEAVRRLPSMLYLVANPDSSAREVKAIRAWNKTFGVSSDEYTTALHNYYIANANSISDKHMMELGFVKQAGGSSKWAWDQ